MDGRPERPRDTWAMIPRELIERAPDDVCLRIFAYLDLCQGEKGWPVRGIGRVARALALQERTVSKHYGHLEKAGWIRVEREEGTAKKKLARVIHNPARRRWADGVSALPDRPGRYREPSRIGQVLAHFAEHDHDEETGFEPSDESALGQSGGAPDAPPDARAAHLEDPTCGASGAPQSLSKRSEWCSVEQSGEVAACSACRQEPVSWLVFLVGGGEQQVCDDDADALVRQGGVARRVRVDPRDPASFPGDPFTVDSTTNQALSRLTLSLLLEAFPGADVID